MRKTTVLLTVLLAAFALQAGATVITTVPVSARITMPAVNYFGSGPQIGFGPVPYTWTSTSGFGSSVYGFTFPYGFGDNGTWDGSLGPMAGVNDSSDYPYPHPAETMTFKFSAPIYVVGGYFNYAPGGSNPTTIAVYNTGGVLIESYDLTFVTGPGVNLGEWLGFQETTPIGSFTMSDNFIAIASPTPEPGTLVLLGSGALVLAGVISRKPERAIMRSLCLVILAAFVVLPAAVVYGDSIPTGDPVIRTGGGTRSVPITSPIFTITTMTGNSPTDGTPCILTEGGNSTSALGCDFLNDITTHDNTIHELVFIANQNFSGPLTCALSTKLGGPSPFFTECTAGGHVVTFFGGPGIPFGGDFTFGFRGFNANADFLVAANTPEPGTLALLVSGIGALLVRWRSRL